MPKPVKSRFIFNVPLRTTSSDRRKLKARRNAGLRVQNLCLGEAETRRKLMQASDIYKYAKSLPRTIKDKDGKDIPNSERQDAFRIAAKQYRYTEYDLHAYEAIASKKSKWIPKKLDAQTRQKIASRAFKASQKVCFGQAKNVRFKTFNRFRSMEGKTNKQGMVWKNERLKWMGLSLEPILDFQDPFVQYCLGHDVKYCRLVVREFNGKEQWFAQLVLEGKPYVKDKNTTRDIKVGIDLNISNVGFVSSDSAGLLPFAENVPTYQKEIKTLQRKIDRSRRQSNPENYELNFMGRKGRKVIVRLGKNKKGVKRWVRTKNYVKLTAKKRELERRKAAYSQTQNRTLVNNILRHGRHVSAENVSVKGWQKLWGKAISAKSPGFFQSELKRKAESAGGSFTKFSTRSTACSQTHLNGEKHKKTLSQRIHVDVTGPIVHRDLMSAFLAYLVVDDQLPSVEVLQSEYRRLDKALLQAWQQSSEWSLFAKLVGCTERGLACHPLSKTVGNGEKRNQIGVLIDRPKSS